MLRNAFLLIAACAISASAATAFAGNVQVQILDKEGRAVPDAVVVLYPASPGAPPAASKVTIGQQRMRFLPPVTVVSPGSTLHFTNLDRWDHHIRGTTAALGFADASAGADFEMRLAGASAGAPGGEAEVTVEKPGPILLGCHLHGSMRGHVFVTDSAWTVKTDDDAAQLRVWHPEQLVELPRRSLQVGAAPLLDSVQLSVVPRRRRS